MEAHAVAARSALRWGRGLEAGTVRCNCSNCRKTRFWLVFVPTANFRLLQGEEHLADHRFGEGRTRHRFFKRCGAKPFGMATDGSGAAVNVACLDELTAEHLAALPVKCVDGAHDRWNTAPAVTDHP